jgi:hypothetical protein
VHPGAWSEEGFLDETESLNEVLARDERTLAELGVTCDELADDLSLLIEAADLRYLPFSEHLPPDWPGLEENRERLRTVRAKVEARFGSIEHAGGAELRVGGRYEIKLTIYLGDQGCPWSGKISCGIASTDWWIRNTARDLELSGPTLITQLIKEHGFFEGLQSPYRVDPKRLARLLELGPFAPHRSA